MTRGPLYADDYKPQLSGHETFPLRYGWLKKAYDAVETTQGADNKSVFLSDDAIARFGVGKNMVQSMRHWATAAGIIEDGPEPNSLCPTPLGRTLFGREGLDPYMESPTSLWLVHWQLCGTPGKTTWFWGFNHYPASLFERDRLVSGLERLARDRNWARVASSTIKRDVECFVRTYVARNPVGQTTHEDTIESPLAELGLIKPVGKRDGFRFVRGAKSSLGDGAFLYALIAFWRSFSTARTLSFEAVAHEPGSPGRVFLLDENDVADRLVDIESRTSGAFRWSETAGLKQIIRDTELDDKLALKFIKSEFGRTSRRKAA